MTDTTFDEVLALATRLAPADKLRLIAQLAVQLVPTLEQTQREDVLEQRRRYYEEAKKLGPVSPTAGDIIDADRRERDAVLMGKISEDVHA